MSKGKLDTCAEQQLIRIRRLGKAHSYGEIYVKEELLSSKYYWGLVSDGSYNWQPISFELFLSLIAHADKPDYTIEEQESGKGIA